MNALDKALRGGAGRDLPAARRHRARQLQGPHPRRARRAATRSRACCSTPPTGRTSGARSGSPRTSSRRRGRRWSTRSSTECRPDRRSAGPTRRRDAVNAARLVLRRGASGGRADPTRPARARRARGGGGAGGAALRPAVARARWSLSSSAHSPTRVGARVRERRLVGHRRAAPGAARGRRERRRRGDHDARSRSSPAPTSRSTSAPGRCSSTSTRSP